MNQVRRFIASDNIGSWAGISGQMQTDTGHPIHSFCLVNQVIKQFLSENHDDAIGLSVPGMPLGSPGMEFDNRFMPYDVLILYKDGSSKVYAEVRK